MQALDTLAQLTGSWSLERTLVDHRTGVAGSFRGHADVRTSGSEGHYEERGRLRFGAADGPAGRRLLLSASAGAVAVTFADGRPFFELDLRHGACRAVHPCGADRYELEFELASPDSLLERWRVTGPAKDYEAVTRWRRCADCDDGGHARHP